MKTDLEKFIETYKQFGIDIKTYEDEDEDKIRINLNGEEEYSTESDKFHGYFGFYSEIEFTKEGKFIRQGFFE